MRPGTRPVQRRFPGAPGTGPCPDQLAVASRQHRAPPTSPGQNLREHVQVFAAQESPGSFAGRTFGLAGNQCTPADVSWGETDGKMSWVRKFPMMTLDLALVLASTGCAQEARRPQTGRPGAGCSQPRARPSGGRLS
ncbi:MAG: hypothetical protein AB1445_14025 [Bacillota bacterium]